MNEGRLVSVSSRPSLAFGVALVTSTAAGCATRERTVVALRVS